MMTAAVHLWAIRYDDMVQADQVREEIIELAWGAGMADWPAHGRTVDTEVLPSGTWSFAWNGSSALASF
jgi:hypothetical protein